MQEFGENKKRRRAVGMIENKNSSFNKRIRTLEKKSYELATLCDIEVCFVCYGPDGGLHTWPKEKNRVRDILMRYKNGDHAEERIKKRRLDLEEFLKAKKKDYAGKRKEEFERKFPTWDDRLDGFSEKQLRDLDGFLETKLQRLRERLMLLTMKEEEQKHQINNDYQDMNREINSVQQHDFDVFSFFPTETNQKSQAVLKSEYLSPMPIAALPCNLYYPDTIVDSSLASSSNLFSTEFDHSFSHGFFMNRSGSSSSFGSLNSMAKMERQANPFVTDLELRYMQEMGQSSLQEALPIMMWRPMHEAPQFWHMPFQG